MNRLSAGGKWVGVRRRPSRTRTGSALFGKAPRTTCGMKGLLRQGLVELEAFETSGAQTIGKVTTWRSLKLLAYTDGKVVCYKGHRPLSSSFIVLYIYKILNSYDFLKRMKYLEMPVVGRESVPGSSLELYCR